MKGRRKGGEREREVEGGGRRGEKGEEGEGGRRERGRKEGGGREESVECGEKKSIKGYSKRRWVKEGNEGVWGG